MTDKKNIFSKSKKQLLSEKIHDEILEMIIKNATDEDMVLNEGRLMEVFQVSKAPVREALIKLCAEGVLQSVPRYGYLVIRQQEKDKREVSRMRVLLELEALKEEDLPFLAESAHADACAPGNPKDASVEDLKNLFRKLM